MKEKRILIIWLVIIVAAAAAFYLILNQGQDEPKTVDDIQKEINRLEEFKRRLEEDAAKVDSGEVLCVLIYAPVCGKDGKTYSNECFAEAAGAEVDHQGECK